MKIFKEISTISLLLIIVLGSTLLVRHYFFYDEIFSDVGSWNTFFTVFGVLYAIIASSLLVNVLERFSALSKTIDEELHALEEVRDLLIYVDGNEVVKYQIQESLLAYVNSVLKRAEDEMGNISKSVDSDTTSQLHKLMETIHLLEVTNESDRFALGALIAKIDHIGALRAKRISLAREQLPFGLHILVLFMSLILLFGFMFLGVQNVWIHILIVFSITVAVYLINRVLSDLSHPFWGVWNISKEPLHKFRVKLEKSLDSGHEARESSKA